MRSALMAFALSAFVLAPLAGQDSRPRRDRDRGAPKVGAIAPDFDLKVENGGESVRLSSFRGKRPVAIIFGSYT